MALKNKDRELIVDTALGGEPDPEKDDPLVLAHVSGAEGISMPFAFDLTMAGTKDAEIAAARIVGHRARFGIRRNKLVNGEREPGFEERFGVLETFEQVGMVNGRRVFRGRLVPAFRMTAFEQRYRVFEDKTLVDILKEVLDDFPLVDVRHNLVGEVKNRVIPYAVQFNETTFAFIHRLLDRAGISYRFEHDVDLRRERMVLSDRIHRPGPVDGAMRVMGDDKGHFDAIAGFRRSFASTAQNLRVADFNTLDPTRSPEGLAIIDQGYAMGAESIGIRVEAFPASGLDPEDPDALAKLRMRKNESAVLAASGRTRSTGFYAGRQFPIGADETGSGAEGKSWVLKLVTIEAFHLVDDRSGAEKFWGFLKSAAGMGDGREGDLVGRAAEQLRDHLKDDVGKGVEVGQWLANSPGASNPSALPGFIADKIGRVGTGIFGGATLLYSTIKGIAEIIQKAFEDASAFACAFEAFPVDDPQKPDRWPTPSSTRPLAAGPHLALVVGPKGVDASDNDIFTDALGRVRVRFPWDPGPPGSGPDVPAGNPLSHDRNTTWVRVSDGWAGERYGMQFLPRIGQEVIVGFLDGDPERPMVVGRAYNAASGNTHLPYPAQSVAKTSLTKLPDLPGTANAATTRSGVRTKSVPAKGATDAGFHMIRFEDEKGKEQFLLRAEHRLDTTSTGSRYDTTRGSQHLLVGGGPPPEGQDSGGGLFISVGGEIDVHAKDNRFTKVLQDNTTVEADSISDIGAAFVVQAGSHIALVAPQIVLDASKEIKLVVGSSEIVIKPSGVFTAGPIIQDKASGSTYSYSIETVGEPLDAAEADPGEPADWLEQKRAAAKGRGGGRRKTKELRRPSAPYVTRQPDGRFKVDGVVVDPGPGGDMDFVDGVVSDLSDLRNDPVTGATLKDAGARKNPVVISKAPPGGDPNPTSTPVDPAAATAAGQPTGRTGPDGKPEIGTGKGSGTNVAYDPASMDREHGAKPLALAIEQPADDAGTNPANSFGPDRVPGPPANGPAP